MTLHGLLRVRGFTQDDAHIFCSQEQMQEEISRILDLTQLILKKLGFSEYKIELSTRDPEYPEKYMGSENEWLFAQKALANVLENKKIKTLPSQRNEIKAQKAGNHPNGRTHNIMRGHSV